MYVGHAVHTVIRIRSLAAHEGLILKQLRLAALKESPDAFSPTLDAVDRQDDDYWRQSAQRTAEAPRFNIFIAEREGRFVGLVSGNADAKQTGHIGMMWADPDVRGQGIGKKLLGHVMDYLKDLSCRSIELTVTETNQTAINLYENVGFAFTGNDVPLRAGSNLQNRQMRLAQT